MDLDANDLLLFARVAEAGSFSRAAERVRLPKSTVSRRIAALEKRLGERLLQRSTRKLSITDFGFGVLDHARALAAEVDSAQALAQHRQAKPSGRLRVSMPGDFASFALPAMLADFVREHPAIQLELDLSPRRVDLIGENFDLAVRMGELPDDSQLAARRLAEMAMGLYAAPGYLDQVGEPATPDDLLALHGLLLLGRGGEAKGWQLERGADETRVRWEGAPARLSSANSPEVLLHMALAGSGVVAVPHFYAASRLREGRLRRVLPEWCLPATNCWAVFPGRRLMPARTRVFLDALAATMATCVEPSVRV
ncbi:LysR family transcriptional regulator [Aquincola sp. S2]|uniref:LysR family transcriptional regulator n=1 Tax=Pseudaquabacterium terrae TaxID=2732868 RepID=A0ABX2EL44_9BURK|nr:LysR family transcriptional regulator [Aquabacterium terrae]NRF69350.1 LysR family transcriptional regulator [Aquabacterium terrae]